MEVKGISEFIDSKGQKCSFQISSSVTPSIWLGVDSPTISNGKEDLKLPEGYIQYSRMHLTQEQVANLLPLLNRFVETGNI